MTATQPERTRTRRRRWPFILIAAVLVLAIAAVIVAAVAIKRAPTVGALADAQPGQWSSIPLPAPARNGDGSSYSLFVKPGSGANLIVVFGDGGLNWNEQTTREPITPQSSFFGTGGNFYSDNVPFTALSSFGGLLRTDAPAPFGDSTIVYIPTTTGDLGVGDGQAVTMTSEEGDTATADFNGYNNSRAALDWVYENVPAPAGVLVAGAGTGGLNAAFWLGDVGGHYSDVPLIEYSDSSFITAAALPYTIGALWQSQFTTRFGFAPGTDPLRSAVVHNTAAFGSRLTTLLSLSMLDRTLAGFSAGLDDGYYTPQAGADWNYAMKSTVRALTTDGGGVYVYLTEAGADSRGETRHVLSTVDSFQTDRQDGVTVEEWLAAAVAGHPESVGAQLARQ
ncbi:hypothetical protein [Subtercola boreus]|uniref:Uncharacterized protein n=1 Tax=Subtercola boreus TaxID=120213 RepID=A0A3E0WEA3_9MICO|nr:hypothetical protein [Subtercola boreus]RFA23355.1 hypothetical protein B7R24_00140 [Subtercola boreus]RFA23748.1 hypothetical protein B7R23_00140 [Subtercola boreus]RFA29448.1 hypothetical protein B7R25_00135 [Subtercola boreus]